MNQKREKKKKKKDRSILEKEINSFMTACMRACLDQALDEIFKDSGSGTQQRFIRRMVMISRWYRGSFSTVPPQSHRDTSV